MPVSKKAPVNAGKPSQPKSTSGASSAKGAPTGAAKRASQKPATGEAPVKSDTAQNLQQAPVTTAKSAAIALKNAQGKNAKKQEKPAQQAKVEAAPASKNKVKGAKEKPKKAKLVRDSFTMPGDEYQVIGDIKKACIGAGFVIKKSELLRIGVALLQKMSPAQIHASLADLPAIKAGRPKKD
jgi:prolyl oligopeptidase PreP (S9A serine peptidase family)